jgi:hypothetical protein
MKCFSGGEHETNAIAFSREGSRRAFGQGLGLGRNPCTGDSAGLLLGPHGQARRSALQAPAQVGPLPVAEDLRTLALSVRQLGHVLSLDEVAAIMSIDTDEAACLFPAFGDMDDRSVLRDDVVEFLERSEV